MAVPGVYVTTDIRSGPPAGVAPPSAALFVVGESAFGPTDVVQTVVSMTDFESKYGGRYGNGYLWDTAKLFFEEGGNTLHVLRLWKDATPATPFLQKVAKAVFTPTSDPDSELTFYAKYLGIWAETTVVTWTQSGGVITITGLPGNRTETFSGLTTIGSIVTAINDPVTGSDWVTAEITLTPSTGVPPTDPNATITGATATVTLDGATVAMTPLFADVITAYSVADADPQYFAKSLGVGAVCAPGYGPTTTNTGTDDGYDVWHAMIRHCIKYNRIAVLAFGDDMMTVDNLIAGKDAFVAFMRAKTDVPQTTWGLEYASVAAPWVVIPNGVGGSSVAPPEGFVAAARSRAQAADGPQRAGAGAISASVFVLRPSMYFTNRELERLDGANVNPIKVVAGSTRVYGARSISIDQVNWKFITYRDVMNSISIEAENRLEPYVFTKVDSSGLLFSRIRGELLAFLQTLAAEGALYARAESAGNQGDPGYTVLIDPTLNPVEQLAEGVISAELGVRVSPVGERFNIRITKASLTSTL